MTSTWYSTQVGMPGGCPEGLPQPTWQAQQINATPQSCPAHAGCCQITPVPALHHSLGCCVPFVAYMADPPINTPASPRPARGLFVWGVTAPPAAHPAGLPDQCTPLVLALHQTLDLARIHRNAGRQDLRAPCCDRHVILNAHLLQGDTLRNDTSYQFLYQCCHAQNTTAD